MKKIKLNIPDERMLQLPDILKARGKIRFRQEFCDDIEIPKQNIRNIRLGRQYFTVRHIQNACKKYGINANWVMGIQANIFIIETLSHQSLKSLPPRKQNFAKSKNHG